MKQQGVCHCGTCPAQKKERYLKCEWEYVLYVLYAEKMCKNYIKISYSYNTNLQVQK